MKEHQEDIKKENQNSCVAVHIFHKTTLFRFQKCKNLIIQTRFEEMYNQRKVFHTL